MVAAKVKQGRLKALLIETSYTNARPDNLRFGHLTPHRLLSCLHELVQAAGGNALKNLPVRYRGWQDTAEASKMWR